MSNSLAPANRSRLPALVLAIAMAPSFVCAINIPPEIPCEVTMQPSWRILGSRQVPNPAQIGKPVEVIWQVEATGGLYRPSYTSGDPPPADVLISQWGIDGYGALSGGGGVITISDEFTARNGQVRYWGLKRAYYIDPCGTGGKKFGDGSLPMMYHTISLEPAPPNEPPIHDGDIDDFHPLPVNSPPPPPDPPSPDDSPRPDQGEAEFVQEVADPASYFMDPSRGWLPKRSDKYVIIKKDLNDPLYEGANDEYVELIYRLITINSPEPRTLHGTLMIDVEEGNPSDYRIIHRNKETGHDQVISLPYQMPVTEPGHEGGGIHDWHNGFESFSFRRIGDGGLRLKFTVDPTEGDPFKTASLHLLPVEVNSMDRYLSGSIPESMIENFGGESKFGLVFRNPSSGETYSFNKLSEAHVYDDPFGATDEDEDKFLSNSEIAAWANGPNSASKELTQDVVFYRKDGKLHFRTLFDQAGAIEIGLIKDGQEIGKIDWTLKPDAQIADLLETVDNILSGNYDDGGGIIVAAIRATGVDFVDDLKQIFGPPLPAFDGVGFNRVMEYLDTNGAWVNQTRWQSKGGQLFFDSGSQQGHRISHVLTHTQPGYKPAPHSVFSGMRDQMFDLLDEGWNKPPTARVQGLRADGSPDPIAWVVDLGKVVGTGGQTKIRYVIKSGTTGDVISAYPVFDLMP